MKQKISYGVLTIILIGIFGCVGWLGMITYYDPTTYKNLTDAKPEVIFLYETFTTDKFDTVRVQAIQLRLAQMYEYERGKGEQNKETTVQIEIIRDMFNRHIKNRKNSGKWDTIHCTIQQNMIGRAFSIAIETERLKNKNEPR
ncbi:MAG: hypothetical protein HYW78_00840 [Parcubacteria group bacterium]|nr:hypothetical protein [Parcubacteria group bacterium]